MPDLSSPLRDLIEGSVTPIDLDAIVRARRRRRLRRRVGSAASVVVITALVTGGVLAEAAHDSKTLSVRPLGHSSEADATQTALGGLTILSPAGAHSLVPDLARGSVSVVDPASSITRQIPFPVASMQSAGMPFALGSNLVFVLEPAPEVNHPSAGTAYVVSGDLAQWRSIGSASAVIAAHEPNRVWRAAFGSVVEQGIDGGNQSRSYPLTGGRTPVAAVAGGLVTTRPGAPNSGQSVLELWNPATNRVVRRFGSNAYLVAAGGDHVVWDACANACTRHALDLATGRDRVLAAPVGMVWGSEAAISPDGQTVALAAHTPLPRGEESSQNPSVPSGSRASIVSVVNVSSGQQTVRRVSTWKGATPLRWSPDGSLLFFARDTMHVAYFNTEFPNSSVRDLAVPNADAFLIAAIPTPSATTQQYEYDGLVAQSHNHSLELCVYPTTAIGGPDADSCNGPLIVGWSSTKTSGRFHLVGTYDGDVFTLTQPPTPVKSSPRRRPVPTVGTPCTPPPGGWQVTNPGRVGLADYQAMTDAARADPDFAGIWSGPNATTGGVTDVARSVTNVAFTANLDAHRRMLADLWGGPICVVQHRRAYAELQAAEQALFGAYGRDLGLQMISAGPDEVNDVVRADAIAATDEMRRAIDRRFGTETVDLETRLRPVPTGATGG